MPVTINSVDGTCSDCGKRIAGDITFKAAEAGPVTVLATGTIVNAGSEHHNSPESRASGKEHGGFVLDRVEDGKIRTIGIITAAAGETVAVALVTDESARHKLAKEMLQIRGEVGI